MNITDEQINEAKKEHMENYKNYYFESDDCIRIAAEWIDAQTKTKNPTNFISKGNIEHWAQRYVSNSDVIVAAKILGLKYKLGRYNVSLVRVFPLVSRIKNIKSAFTMGNYYNSRPRFTYKKIIFLS